MRYGDRRLWPAADQRSNRCAWELLLFLACQPPEGISRATLADTFWPEVGGVLDGNHVVRQLRYRLRTLQRSQAPGLLREPICIDAGIHRLDPAVVASDAQQFLALERAFRRSVGVQAIGLGEQARTLCGRGRLLDGPAARCFRWLDERDASGVTPREHFARLAHRLTWRLAELYVAAGRCDDGVRLYQELTVDDPGDDRLWEGLLAVLRLRGDQIGVRRAEGRWRAALREALPRAG